MKESKAVYVTKRDIKVELNREYQLYTNNIIRDRDYSPSSLRYVQKTNEVGCQYDCKRDNLICTCRNLATLRKRQEVRYFGLPKQIYAYHGSRSYTDIGVGSVKALQRKKVRKIYLPETDDRGVGSSELSAYILRRARQPRVGSYYENKRTSSKCVGGILEYNTGCVMNEKLSPIVQTISGATSPRESKSNRNIEIGSHTIVTNLANTTTQVEDIIKKEIDIKPEVKVDQVVPIIIVKEDIKDMKTKTIDTHNTIDSKGKLDKVYSSDSLVQHVHNLENPSDEKQSHCSMDNEDPMENKLEREYRRIFAAKSKSRESKSTSDRPIPDFKSTSTLKRRFEALRRGLVKKEDSKKNAVIVNKVSSQISAPSRKDVSINSDPPSLEGRSYSNTKTYSPFTATYSRDKTIYNPRTSHYRQAKKERDSAQWSVSRPDDEDSECQGVKGMFKLWGKKFNLEEDTYKRRCTPRPSYVSSRKSPIKKIEDSNVIIKPEIEIKKEGRKFFFFKKKHKECKEKPYKAKKGVTAGRCEVRDGLIIKIGGGGNAYVPEDIVKEPENVPDDYEDMVRKAWIKNFLTHSIESQNSVQVRWNNKTYAPSSSTVFELMDTVYKDTGVVFRSKSQMTVHSSYKSYTKQHVNFIHQNIEAWMIPKTMTDRPKLLPVKLKCKSDEDRKNNIEVRISDQKWFIDKSKAFSHKIEVVLHSKNFRKLNKKESSDYLRIDIPKGFFVDSSSDDNNKNQPNQSSDEEVYKIVEYETGSDLKKDKTMRNFDTGDHRPNNIKVTVSVKETKDCDSKTLETTIKRPPIHRDVVIQDSNVYIPKRCDVIGVGIITQRDLREVRKPILKIQDDYSDEESEHNDLRSNQKKCEFAESYLQEYYRHWTPLGIDLYSWCVSDSHLRCCSENSRASFNNQGDGTKSCPNIFDDFQASTIVSSCGASSCSQCHTHDDTNKTNEKTSWFGKLRKKSKDKAAYKKEANRRILPKDSIEVFKRRKIYAASAKSKWMVPCPDFDTPYSVPSVECKGAQNSPLSECPKLMKSCCKPIEPKPRRRQCKKHVSLPDCDTMNNLLAKQLADVMPEGILAFKGGTGCEICKRKGSSSCPKHCKVIPEPTCEIPRPPCRDSCEQMKKPPCSDSKVSCDRPPPCPGPPQPCPPSPCKKPCPPSPPPCRRPPSCPPSPPPCRKPPSCPPTPPCKKSPPPCPSPPPPRKKSPPCPPSPPPCKKPSPCPPTPPPSCKKPSTCPPSPPVCKQRPSRCPPSPPPCKRPPPCPPSPPPCKKPPSCPPSPPACRKPPPCPTPPCKKPPPRCPSHPSCPHIRMATCPSTPSPCPSPPPPCPPTPPKCPPSPPPCPHIPSCPPSPPPCPHKPSCPPSPPPCPHKPSCPPSPPPCPHVPSCLPPPCPHSQPPPCPPSPPPCPPSPPPCPSSPPPCPHSPPCPPSPPCYYPPPPPCRRPPSCPHSPPCTPPPPPCYRSNKPCPLAPPSCPNSPPSCCSMDPDRCPALPPPCKKASSICKKLSPFFKRKSNICPASPPCKPTPCKPAFCKGMSCQSPCDIPKCGQSPCQKFSKTSCSYGSLHPTPDAPFFYSPIHPCPPEYEKPKKKGLPCNSSPCNVHRPKPFDCMEGIKKPSSNHDCDHCHKSAEDFPWPTKNQVSNQSSVTSIFNAQPGAQCPTGQEDETIKYGECKKSCPMMPKLSCDTIPSPKKECKDSCPNKPTGEPRPPCIPQMQCPPPKPPCPPTPPSPPKTPQKCRSKSKMSGLFLKMKPSKKKTCSKDCLAWDSARREDGCISLNSEEKITIRLKKETPSTQEIREGLNIKVQDEDGMTLFERKDYRLQRAGCSIQRPSLLGDMYKASEVRRVTTNNSVQAIGDKDRKEITESKSDASIANLIEIQFKLKVTQGEKTTEINIANDGDKEIEHDEKIQGKDHLNKTTQEVFVVKDGGERPVDHSDPKNDINIRIVIKNFKPKSGKRKSTNAQRDEYSKDFSKKISAKFHTVSTGYSDVLHDDNVFSIHRATVDLTSSVDKSKTHSNRSEELMSEPLVQHGRGILMGSSEPSICRCITTDMSEPKSEEDTEVKSITSQKYSGTKDTPENLDETDTEKLTDHKYEYTEETDTDKPIKYDTEETDTDKQIEPKYDTEETDTDKRAEQKYETFMSTDDEPDTVPEIKKSSLEVIVKPHTKDEKKEMLKLVFEKAHESKGKNKNRMRKLRDMLKVILTSDSSDHDDSKLHNNELAKDVTYASLKPNYFRDSDSMNNYYRAESHALLSEGEINRQVVYPTEENNSECSNNSNQSDVLSSDNDSPKGGGCMCSTVAARLKLASRIEGGGCCCGTKPNIKKNEETTCDLKKESDYFQYDYKATEFVDVETQNSRYLTNKINSTNLSVHRSMRSSIIANTEQDLKQNSGNSGVINVDDRHYNIRKTFSPHMNHVKECEMRKLNRNTILSISDEDKIVLVSDKTDANKNKDKKKKCKDPITTIHASDILQSYETKKAVLEIYTEKTVSDEGERLVAKLPKFVYDRENEIQTNYEAMATNTYKAVCKRNIVMMAINR